MAMGQGYRRITGPSLSPHQNTHGPSNDMAPSDHHGMFSLGLYLIPFQEFQDPKGGSRNKSTHIQCHFTKIGGMESVHILVGIYGQQYPLGIDLRWQGQLDYRSEEHTSELQSR